MRYRYKFLITFLIAFCSIQLLFCQSFIDQDSLNRLDANHKKHGYWIEYVNKKLKEVKKPKKAPFFRYIYYYHGMKMYPPNYSFGKLSLVIDGNEINDSIVIMNGKYCLYNFHRKIGEECFLNGKPVYIKSYYKNGDVCEYIDYTKKLENQEFSYYGIMYDELGRVTYEGFFGIVNNKFVSPIHCKPKLDKE